MEIRNRGENASTTAKEELCNEMDTGTIDACVRMHVFKLIRSKQES